MALQPLFIRGLKQLSAYPKLENLLCQVSRHTWQGNLSRAKSDDRHTR